MLSVVGSRPIRLTVGVLAIAGLARNPSTAHTADLGGDCCADLEQRVAELEAATVRKAGKVSVTVSGYVAKQVMSWDDGVERNTYVADIGPTQATNFRISGQATIAPGWTAGYLIRIQDLSDNTMLLNQFNDNDRQGLNVQMVNWFVAGEDYGRLTVGKQALASKSAAMFTDLSGTQLIANYVLFDGGGFFLRQRGELISLKWGDLGYCYSQSRPWGGDCDGIVMEGVRYDSPTYAGFSWSGSFGQDDDWEAAGRYAGEMGGFKIALGIGYSVNTDENLQARVSFGKDSGFFQAGGYVAASRYGVVPTRRLRQRGQSRYAHLERPQGARQPSMVCEDRHSAEMDRSRRHDCLRRIYQYIDQIGPAALNAGVTSSEFTRWGFGVAQEIDKAAMTLWLKYRQHDGELTGGPFAGDLDAFQYVSAGGLIYF